MTPDVPRPIAMQSDVAIYRMVSENCQNELDARPGARVVELDPVLLPDGRIVITRCSHDKKGHLVITVRFSEVTK